MGIKQCFSIKLYTEDKDRPYIWEVLKTWRIAAFTAYLTIGNVNGVREESIVIEVITDDPNSENLMYAAAEDIRIHNKQESVLVVTSEVTVLDIKHRGN